MVIKNLNWKQWLMPVIKLTVAAALITWLVQSGKVDFEALKKINQPLVWLLCSALFFCTLMINAKRWQWLLSIENVSMSYLQSLRLSLIGIFFNFVIPGGVGGDVVKAGYLIKEQPEKKWFIGWSVFVDRVLGMLALLVYSGVAGVLFYQELKGEIQYTIYSLSVLILFGFVVGVAILVFSPKAAIEKLLLSHPLLEKTLHPLYFFLRKPKGMVFPFLISFLGQGSIMTISYTLAYFLGLDIPFWVFLLLFPFGFLAMVIPISPAGLGVGQAAFYFLFESVIGQGAFGVLVVSFFQAIQFLIGILGGLLFVLYKKKEV